MPQFPGHPVVPIDHLSSRNEPRPQTGPERYHDEVPHLTGIAVSDLPESGGIGVVGDTDGNPGKRVADLLAKREKPPPFLRIRLSGSKLPEIDRTLDPARMIVGIRSTDPDPRQHGIGRHTPAEFPQHHSERFHISRIVVEKRVFRRTKRRPGIDFTRAIDQTENRIDPSDVNADDQFFHKKDKFYRFISQKYNGYL